MKGFRIKGRFLEKLTGRHRAKGKQQFHGDVICPSAASPIFHNKKSHWKNMWTANGHGKSCIVTAENQGRYTDQKHHNVAQLLLMDCKANWIIERRGLFGGKGIEMVFIQNAYVYAYTCAHINTYLSEIIEMFIYWVSKHSKVVK